MSVWCAVVASMTFMYMVSPEYEWSTTIRVILAVVYATTFIGGTICDSNRQNKIERLEREIKKLKENLST